MTTKHYHVDHVDGVRTLSAYIETSQARAEIRAQSIARRCPWGDYILLHECSDPVCGTSEDVRHYTPKTRIAS